MERIDWHEAKEYLREFNRQHGYKCSNSGCSETAHIVVVFTADSFDEEYSEESRSYIVSSNNKAFLDGMIGYSIYASCLDGTDPCVRLEAYMRDEYGGEGCWKVEYCYIKD
jgi:hypothetical protein